MELRRLGNKIRFTVHFDHYADFTCAMNIGFDHAFGSNPTRFLRCSSQSFFTQIVYCFFHIAIRFNQGFFAVHHAGAGCFTQFFNHLC